jgi:hypothetical protein
VDEVLAKTPIFRESGYSALGGGKRLTALTATTEDIASEIGNCQPDADLVEIEVQTLQDYWANLLGKAN